MQQKEFDPWQPCCSVVLPSVPLLSIHLDLRCLTFHLNRAAQDEVIAVNAGDSAVVVVWLFGREVKRRPVSAADHQKVNSWRSQQWIQNPIFEFNLNI